MHGAREEMCRFLDHGSYNLLVRGARLPFGFEKLRRCIFEAAKRIPWVTETLNDCGSLGMAPEGFFFFFQCPIESAGSLQYTRRDILRVFWDGTHISTKGIESADACTRKKKQSGLRRMSVTEAV